MIFKLDESIEKGIYMYNVITKVNEENHLSEDDSNDTEDDSDE